MTKSAPAPGRSTHLRGTLFDHQPPQRQPRSIIIVLSFYFLLPIPHDTITSTTRTGQSLSAQPFFLLSKISSNVFTWHTETSYLLSFLARVCMCIFHQAIIIITIQMIVTKYCDNKNNPFLHQSDMQCETHGIRNPNVRVREKKKFKCSRARDREFKNTNTVLSFSVNTAKIHNYYNNNNNNKYEWEHLMGRSIWEQEPG